MDKKNLLIIITIAIFVLLLSGVCLYFFIIQKSGQGEIQPYADSPSNSTDDLVLDTEGNDMVITTNSNSTIRVINKYDLSLFKGKKSLLIMWGSWCPNCSEEMAEIEKILDKYSNNNDINIVLIAHEYKDTVKKLITMLENDVTFDAEIFLDLGRVIRKHLDPAASTIPTSYLIDENGNVLTKHSEAISLQIATDMIENN